MPRIAKTTNHFLTVRGIVNQKRHVYGPTHFREDGVEVDIDDEPVVSSFYWLKDQDDEIWRRTFWDSGEEDISYEIVFQGPSTPWLDEFIHTEHLCVDTYSLDEKQKRYKDECVMSGKKVARLHLPFVYDEGGYEDLDSAKLFIKNYEFNVYDLEVLIYVMVQLIQKGFYPYIIKKLFLC